MSRKTPLAYVGCRTTKERNARGEGISVFEAPGDGRAWRLRQHLTGLTNPSFLAFDRTGAMLYAVHGDASEVSAFRIDAGAGTLSFVNQVSTGGRNPVHLAVDRANAHLVIANHITRGAHVSGLAVIALEADGRLGAMTDQLPSAGTPGPHRSEQPFAKPHQCQFDPSGTVLAVPDKGLDETVCYRLDDAGRISRVAGPAAASREGEGPRHITFHPTAPYAYVVNELSSTLTACRFEVTSGALQPVQVLSCLPDSFTGFSRAAEIEISADGRFVYASNRGFDSIGVFAVDIASGRLSPLGWAESGGRTPRFFTISPDGAALLVANEDSDTICHLARDHDTGLLGPACVVAETGSPTCILFAP